MVKALAAAAPWRSDCSKPCKAVTVKVAVPVPFNVTDDGLNDSPPPFAGGVTFTWPMKPVLNGTVIPTVAGCPGATFTDAGAVTLPTRSEERRVGKECRSRGWPYHQ